MTKAPNRLTSLLHRLGVAGPARLRAFQGTSAPALLLTIGALTAGVNVALPATAGAYATVGPTPLAGSPGLPDGRVYEQVSPPNKNGNSAGEPGIPTPPTMFAEGAGDGVAYNGLNSIGNTKSGGQFMFVAKRAAGGWLTYGAQPRSTGEQALLGLIPHEIGFSEDLTKVFFWSSDTFLPEVREEAALLYDIAGGSTAWLDPPPASSEANADAVVAGFSGDMSTFYFRTRTGFYEWHDGVLSVAGVLPDGSVEPAALAAGVPANPEEAAQQASDLRNEVSEDGSRAFFVSSAGELYVRETAADGAQSTVLVSRDTLLAPVNGLPAPAPHGALKIRFPREQSEGEALSAESGSVFSSEGYLYASPDGSRAFFESIDALTSGAREAEEHGLPAGDVKAYMFDTGSGALEYLPGVADQPELKLGERSYGVSPVLVSSRDGSRFIFNGQSGLSLWSDVGPGGGTVTPIEPFPAGGEARATPDGSVFVFDSAAPLAGFNNGGSHFALGSGEGPLPNQEIYRYDVGSDSLTCVSCPPAGIASSGNAYMSHDASNGTQQGVLFEDRGVSTDGSRVFFDTPDPLVPQDSNTRPLELNPHPNPVYFEHGRDVYEWENGRIFLISTGTSGHNSYLGDVSANGNDAFFSTSQGLAPGDADEAYDVYDARIPRPGDHAPPPAAACEGDVCQGPPSVPVLLGAPASETFNGLGNPAPESVLGGRGPNTKPRPKSKAKGCKKGFVKRKNKCVKKPKAKKSAKGRK
jgi:hypothetical protein